MTKPATAHGESRRLIREAFFAGQLRAVPVSIATGVWGIVTGVAMVNSGLSPWQAVGMTLLVFAGAAQLAVLPLIVAKAPVWVILVAALVVNLRFLIFSAGLVPYLRNQSLTRRMLLGYGTGDFAFAVCTTQWLAQPADKRGSPEQIWFMLGVIFSTWSVWQMSSLAGIMLGAQIPPAWGLDFAVVVSLIGVTIPMIYNRPGLAGAIVAAIVAVLGAALPLKLGLVAAVLAGTGVAMALDRAQEQT
jgi:predicted branched-subunit amino acid permease